jgi:hypothetical protein
MKAKNFNILKTVLQKNENSSKFYFFKTVLHTKKKPFRILFFKNCPSDKGKFSISVRLTLLKQWKIL